ncbi:MAG TPA: hypothetical protein VE442_01455 [Jatrophihabitans sp.]|jgi:hypothetical protein|nr:hypothetical protein [Jatrophihabitans sp.]
MKRFLVALVCLLAVALGATAGASTSTTALSRGGSLHVTCTGANLHREALSHRDWTITCGAAPTSTPTPSPSPTGSTSPPPTGSGCTTSRHSGACGAYDYDQITNSNGYNTYVGNNMWACGPESDTTSCGPQTLTAAGPGDWKVVSKQAAGNTAVLTYPDTQQLTNNWNGSGWGGNNGFSDTPINGLSQLSSNYAETMPRTSGTDAQAAWDIWLSDNSGHPSEIMVWVDNVNRGNGGATFKASATVAGQAWTLYQYGGGEIIWSLGARGSYAQQSSGTVDLLALLRYLQTNGYIAAGADIGQIDFGWEICSTGGVNGTFTVSAYSIHLAA